MKPRQRMTKMIKRVLKKEDVTVVEEEEEIETKLATKRKSNNYLEVVLIDKQHNFRSWYLDKTEDFEQ